MMQSPDVGRKAAAEATAIQRQAANPTPSVALRASARATHGRSETA